MDKKHLKSGNGKFKLLADAFYETLSGYAMMSGENAREEKFVSADDEYIEFSAGYHGVQSGTVVIAVPLSFCSLVKASLFGEDGVGIPEYDVMKEMINILCGNYATRILGERAKFLIDAPRMERMDRRSWHRLAKIAGEGFMVEQMPVIVYERELR